MGMNANFKLINNALKCNPLKPFVQLIKFSNLNEKIQLLECFSLESTSGKTLYSISFNNIKARSSHTLGILIKIINTPGRALL